MKEIEALFVKILLLAREMGLFKLGTVGLDGTKIHANASKHSALSYEHAAKIEAQLKAEVAELLAKAEAADQADVPDGMSILEERLKKIAEAKAKIEARAKERTERELADPPQSIAPQASAIAAWLPLPAETTGRLLPLLPSTLLEFAPMGGMMLASILWDVGGAQYASGERGPVPTESRNKRASPKKRGMTRDETLEALRSMVQTTPEGKFIIASGNALARKLGVNPTFRGWEKHWREKGLVEVARRETKRKIMAAADVA